MFRTMVMAMALLCGMHCQSQTVESKKLSAGIELDVLPYITGGYFAAGWVGKNHIRGRVLTAYVTKPDIFIKEGLTNNKVTAYALLVDYFLKDNWKGWWAGTGLVYWKSSIQTDQKSTTAHFDSWFLNGSAGYNFSLGKIFYVSPWAGMHVRIAGQAVKRQTV